VKGRAAAVSSRAVNKVTTVDELAHLILVGTASSSDVQIAIVADTKAKQMERLKVGESYKDWNIAEVSSDHVVFQNAKLEYKLFVTPIKGSQKDKQAKLISQLNKSKIEKATAATKSYKGWKGANKINSSNSNASTNQKHDGTGTLWSYRNKSKKKDLSNNTDLNSAQAKSKSVKRSTIKIPGEEEKDATYYEAEDDDVNSNSPTIGDRASTKREISAEDFYDDEVITEDELKALEGLGAKIFDD